MCNRDVQVLNCFFKIRYNFVTLFYKSCRCLKINDLLLRLVINSGLDSVEVFLLTFLPFLFAFCPSLTI